MKIIAQIVLAFALAVTASAQGNAPPMSQYAAKFVCGVSRLLTSSSIPVAAPGSYFTTINVHNPARSAATTVYKKFTVGLPSEQVGAVTQYFEMKLGGDETMQVDCGDIAKHLNQAPTAFLEGYAVIESSTELDVVAVYTAGSGSGSSVTSIHTERVQPRRMPACANLNLSINTGFPTLPLANPWTLVVAPIGSVPRAPDVPTSIPWPAPYSGSQFISGTPTGSTAGLFVGSRWDYETCFCICPGAQNVRLNLTGVRVDDQAYFFLNNVPIGTVLGQNPQPAEWNTVNTNATTQFRPGRNCLRVKVIDTIVGFSGLDLAGTITGASAACQEGVTAGRGEE